MKQQEKTSKNISTKDILKKTRKRLKNYKTTAELKAEIKKAYENKTWYTIRALLGHHDVNWYVLIGARMRGKTYSVQEYCLSCWFNPESPLYHVPFYWMRLNEIAIKNMLMNNAAKMFEPLLVRKFHLENIKVRGDSIFLNGLLLCRVYGLSTAYNNKGAAIFDADKFKGVNIIIDEIAYEKNQPKRCDVSYNLKSQIENICRNRRDGVKIWLMLNNTEEAPDVLTKLFGYIPIEFGIYKLKRKHCIIDYIPNTEGYNKMRKEALANEIDQGTGNFTNKFVRDLELLTKERLTKPVMVVKFSKDMGDWFTIWEGNIICKYNGEKKPSIAMKRYINDQFLPELRDNIIEQEDVRAFKYKDLLVQTLWRACMESIKK